MFRLLSLAVALCFAVSVISAQAELQNVQVGRELRIKLNLLYNWAVEPGPLEIRIPAFLLPNRPIGEFLSGAPAFNGLGLVSPYAWDDKTNNLTLTEQRTRLNVKADFTNEVAAFLELESYDFWGEDFPSDYIDLQNDLSNVHIFMIGAQAHPMGAIDLHVDLQYIIADDPFDSPKTVSLGGLKVPVAPALSFWTEQGDDELGWVTDIVITYHYSEDLMFSAHWSHLFGGGALEDGAFFAGNGTIFGGGSDDDDGDFITFETRICF